MGPKSQQENDLRGPSGADSDFSDPLEGALLNSSESIDRSSQTAGSPESWAAKPIAQKDRLDFDALRIFVVLALLTAAMAVVMKFLF
ncbi:MAG: hypothetical protein J0L82_05220 [Deltaproteobacteria bacterium]|jgi:hypothetical protein|nr:hypothetical protein [Deltaproteobacteria bacterium]